MTLLDAPPETRKEKRMLAAGLPAVEQESTIAVIDATDPEHLAEPAADACSEAATEPSEPEPPTEPATKPRTGGLPTVPFEPLRKDTVSNEAAAPSTPPMPSNRYFFDDEDELEVVGEPVPIQIMTLDELDEHLADEVERRAALAPIREAEEKARKEKEAKEVAAAEAMRKKRKFLRRLGNYMMAASVLALIYAVIVPYVPWL